MENNSEQPSWLQPPICPSGPSSPSSLWSVLLFWPSSPSRLWLWDDVSRRHSVRRSDVGSARETTATSVNIGGSAPGTCCGGRTTRGCVNRIVTGRHCGRRQGWHSTSPPMTPGYGMTSLLLSLLFCCCVDSLECLLPFSVRSVGNVTQFRRHLKSYRLQHVLNMF